MAGIIQCHFCSISISVLLLTLYVKFIKDKQCTIMQCQDTMAVADAVQPQALSHRIYTYKLKYFGSQSHLPHVSFVCKIHPVTEHTLLPNTVKAWMIYVLC